MRKILVYDHKFNIESLSSCSQIDNSTKFYSSNPKLSFYDNYDSINPDTIWINKAFESLDNYDLKSISSKIIEYNIPFIIPNSMAKKDHEVENIISCIFFNSPDVVNNKIYKYDDTYVRFYNASSENFNHVQYCGQIQTCRDLTDIIVGSSKILIDNNIGKSLCGFYNKTYGIFKPRGAISWNENSDAIINNMELFFSNASK
jgi:hypothetical protein